MWIRGDKVGKQRDQAHHERKRVAGCDDDADRCENAWVQSEYGIRPIEPPGLPAIGSRKSRVYR